MTVGILTCIIFLVTWKIYTLIPERVHDWLDEKTQGWFE